VEASAGLASVSSYAHVALLSSNCGRQQCRYRSCRTTRNPAFPLFHSGSRSNSSLSHRLFARRWFTVRI